MYRITMNNRASGILEMSRLFENRYFRKFAVRRVPPLKDHMFPRMQDQKSPKMTMAELRTRHVGQLHDLFCSNGANKRLKIITLSDTAPTFTTRRGKNVNLLANWPTHAVLFFAQNEIWRLPYGDVLREEFGEDPETKAMPKARVAANIPDNVLPFFHQYWNHGLEETKKDWDRFLPLWVRPEFLRIHNEEEPITPSSKRHYIYNMILAITSDDRTICKAVFEKQTMFETNRTFIHIPKKWSPVITAWDAKYIHSEEYRDYLTKSVFTLAPRGHNPDQYRLYEAIVTGSIPVITESQLDAFAPFYKDAGMVAVPDWQSAPKILADLLSNPDELDARQQQLMKWATNMLQNSIDNLTKVLMEKAEESESNLCTNEMPYKVTPVLHLNIN
eukprot:m.79395 g.79395  ORF g.79395 m.79395 type:complete len:388 (+) comp12713_c0_seq1:565-1728(+)